MKKMGLAALAIGTLASAPAFAQSSVTLYGIVDTGVEYFTHATPAGGSMARMPVVGGGDMPSRWGIKGTEDLGGGLKAVFALESGFSLADYGRAGNYFQRQVSLWTKQYRATETGRLDAMEALIDWLPAHCPTDDTRPSLVHGDFRIDNLIFDSHACRVNALLDWELSTLGHPLADLAYFCMCLRLPSNGPIVGLGGASRALLGLPDEGVLVARYCELRALPTISDWHLYLAVSFFRLAVIAQGVKTRAMHGNASHSNALAVGEMAAQLAAMAVDVIERES